MNKPSIKLIKLAMYKPTGEFNIVRVKNGEYRVYLTHKDAAISCAALSLRFDVKQKDTQTGVCLEVKAKKPASVTIRIDNDSEKSIKSAEKKKAKYENAGYELVKEYGNTALNVSFLTYKIK
ncbi:MAG: hypothetical protein WAT79_08500 [Saprospiraceae bacterium]